MLNGLVLFVFFAYMFAVRIQILRFALICNYAGIGILSPVGESGFEWLGVMDTLALNDLIKRKCWFSSLGISTYPETA